MKKFGFVLLTALLLVVLCALGVSAATVQTGNADVLSGYTASEIPAEALPVSNAIDFAAMEPDGVYYLTADFPLSFTYGDFTGELYGNGHTITTTAPLFNALDGAAIYDLTLAGNIANSAYHVGGIAATATDTTFIGVSNRAAVTNTTTQDNSLVGGLVGRAANVTVKYCTNYGTIEGRRPGGLVGEIDNAEAWLVVENCVNYGYINGNNQTGGFISRAQNASSVRIAYVVNYGTVYVASSDGGGIIGKINNTVPTATLEGCINSGRLDGASCTGGISGWVGVKDLTVIDCHNGCHVGCNTTSCDHGKVTGRVANNIAGFFGCLDQPDPANDTAIIKNSTNTGYIEGVNQAAGFIGWGDPGTLLVEKCYNGCLSGCTSACDHGDIVAKGNSGGGIAGSIGGVNHTIKGFTNTGDITSKSTGGGLFGSNSVSGTLTIEDCFNGCKSGCTTSCDHGEITTNSHAAGMVASRSSVGDATIVRNCTNTGRINGGPSSSAGIVGWSNSEHLEITDCFNGCQNGCADCDHGVISLTSTNNLAGIVACINGDNTSKTVVIRNCTNTADLSTGAITGGIVAGCWATDSITIENCTNTGDMTANNNDIGGIAGHIQPGGSATITVRNCYNEGDFSAANDSCDIGGIVGGLENGNGNTILIEGCTNKGDVKTTNSGNATTRVGGIAGPTRAGKVTIKNCVNDGTLEIASYGAGIVARCQASEEFRIEGCINNGNVTSAREYASGIMGWTADNATITVIDTHNKGDISCSGIAGGILGNWNNVATTMYFESCTNSGSLTGSTATNVGGIVAQITSANTTSVTFRNCHNSASLTSQKQNAAGIVGYINAKTIVFENCSNSGNMTITDASTNDDGAAGIVGFVYNGCTSLTIKNCSNTGNMTTVNCNAAGIIGRSMATGALTISGCTNSGVITVTATDSGKNGNGDPKDCSAGGIAGMITDHSTLTYENCHNGCFSGCTTNCEHGRVVNGAGRAGGIHGYNYGGWITLNFKNCSNSGYITSKWETGGIAGRVNVKILYVENCSNGCFNGCTPAAGEYCTHGMVTNTENADFGGIIGICDHDKCISITLKNCYNNGYLNGTNRGGGMAGALEVNGSKVGSDQTATVLIENCVNEGVVKSGSYAGGISPRVDAVRSNSAAIFRNCINRGDLIPASYAGGMMAWCRNDQDTDGSEIDVLGTYLFENCYNYGNITAKTNAAGIMANMGGGDIQTLTLINCHNSGNITGLGEVAAGLVGWGNADLLIKNCSNSGTIISGALNAPKNHAGGLVAQNTRRSVIMDSSNTGAVSGTYAAGIIAYHDSDEPVEITNCCNSGTITGTGRMGGIIGRSSSGNATQRFIGCSNSGTIYYNSDGNDGVGGILGELTDGNGSLYFENCTNTGDVYDKTKARLGGIFGVAYPVSATFINCHNSGDITSNGNYASGIACRVDVRMGQTLTFTNCSNSGKISSKGAHAGGIIALAGADNTAGEGYRYLKITNCTNTGEIVGTGTYSEAGGIVGTAHAEATLVSCFNSGKIYATVTTNGGNCMGGIVGMAYNAHWYLTDCVNEGAVSSTGHAGGMVGRYNGASGHTVTNCVNKGTITGTGTASTVTGDNHYRGVGGIFGYANVMITLTGCTNEGAVTATVNVFSTGEDPYFGVGGLGGMPRATCVVKNSKNTGAVTMNAGTAVYVLNNLSKEDAGTGAGLGVGGLIGVSGYGNPLTVENCSNSGAVVYNATTACEGYAGGIVGLDVSTVSKLLTVKNSTNHGNVSANASTTTDVIVVAGGIVGRAANGSNITSCTNRGNVTAISKSWLTSAGGMGGMVESIANNTLTDCVNHGNINTNSSAGGMIGFLLVDTTTGTATLTRCKNYGEVSQTNGLATGQYAGGMIGYAQEKFSLSNCENHGNITCEANRAGGMIGQINRAGSSTVTSCINTATVYGQTQAGGIIGNIDSMTVTISNCTNTGAVNGAFIVGGIVGQSNSGSQTVQNCTNYGTINGTSTDEIYAAGIFGVINSGVTSLSVENCTNHGNITVETTATAKYAEAGGMIARTYVEGTTVQSCTNYGKITVDGAGWGSGVAGGMMGTARGTACAEFTDCVNYGEIYVVTENGGAAGGILAYSHDTAGNNPTFTRCTNYGKISANAYAGGILAYLWQQTTFTDCANHGEILASFPKRETNQGNGAGGILCRGDCSAGGSVTFINCVNTGKITTNNYGAGIVADIDDVDLTFTNCTNNGNVTAKGNAAGILGSYNMTVSGKVATFTGCINTGDVKTAGRVGGIVGNSNSKCVIKNCVSTGDITGDQRVGGIAGSLDGGGKAQFSEINNCYVSGTITHIGKTAGGTNAVGGLVGYGWGAQYYTYNVIEADVVLTWTNPGTVSGTSLPCVAVIVGYDNNSGVRFNYNLFIGTINAGDGVAAYLGMNKNSMTYSEPGALTMDPSQIHHNYAMTDVVYPLVFATAVDSTQGTGQPIQIPTGSDAATIASTLGSNFKTVNGTVIPVGAEATYNKAVTPTTTPSAPEAHTHSYATTYTTDANGHWYACTCGATKDFAEHVYDNNCDATCNTCGYERTVANSAHVGEYPCSTTCATCGATITPAVSHIYGGACDADCNRCGATRTATGTHAGENACSTTCKVCGEAVTPGAHTYSNSCDSACDECGAKRTEGLVHVGAYACSTTCKFCSTAIEATGAHVGAYDCATECKLCHATITTPGDHTYTNSCDVSCDKCGAVRELPANSHVYTNDCDVTCDNCLAVRTVDPSVHVGEKSCSDTCATCGVSITPAQPHTGAYSCATECQWCGTEIEPGQHTPAEACSEICKDCGADIEPTADHTFDHSCDLDCNLCGADNTEIEHAFANDCDKTCDNGCGHERDDSELKHTFANNCTAKCTYCDFTRDESELRHTYPYPCADKCQFCETDLVPGEHTHEHDCSTACYYCQAAIDPKGEHAYSGPCDLICNVCGAERAATGAHQYHSDCDTTCNVCGAVRVAPVEHTREYACSAGCMYCGEPMDGATDHIYAYDCDATCENCGHVRTFADGLQAHSYDNRCDADCNYNCGTTRPVGAHKGLYACSTECKYCGAEIEGKEHKYSNACDADCNYNCGETREVGEHQYTNACDATCNICEATREIEGHKYDNACDADCNLCGEGRVVEGHSYDSVCDADCNNCGTPRDVEGHKYDNACDADCNVCGQAREVGKHQYTNGCDATCNICKAVRYVRGHQYGDWVITKPATVEALGEKSRTCSICGKVDTDEIPRLEATEDDQQPQPEQPESGDANDGSNDAGSGDNAGTGDEQSNNNMMMIIIIAAAAGAVVVVVAVAVVVNKKKSKKKAQKND